MAVKVLGELHQSSGFRAGVAKQLVNVHRHTPSTDAEAEKQIVQPIGAASCAPKTLVGLKHVYVRLPSQIFSRTIRGRIVDDEKALDAEGTVMTEKRREPQRFVPALGEQPNLSGAVGHLGLPGIVEQM
jgi:hypothetical protein